MINEKAGKKPNSAMILRIASHYGYSIGDGCTLIIGQLESKSKWLQKWYTCEWDFLEMLVTIKVKRKGGKKAWGVKKWSSCFFRHLCVRLKLCR